MRTGLLIFLLMALWLFTAVPVLAQKATDPEARPPVSADLDSSDTEVVEAALRLHIATTDKNEPVRVIIWLADNPAGQIVSEERAKVADELAANAAAVQERFRMLRPEGSLTEEQEEAFVRNRGFQLGTEEDSFVDLMVDRQEALQDQWREQANRRIHAATQQQRLAVEANLDSMGARETTWLLTANAFATVVPVDRIAEIANLPEVASISHYELPRALLDDTKISLGISSTYWPEGMNGRGWDIGIIDTGFQQNHPNLAPRDGWITPPGYSSVDTDGHGTAVAGVIFSNDSSYRGAIYDLHTATVGGTDAGNVIGNVLEHADWMVTQASQKPEVINGSFGVDGPIAYDSINRFWDALADQNNVTLVFAAGNCGPGTCVNRPSNGYNTLSVASIDDDNDASRGNDQIVNDSGRGPTTDLRKKPDIAAPGENIRTTTADWDDTCFLFSCPNFADISGTSFAAPHVAAAAMLLVEQRADREPTAIRAALINSAQSWSDNGTNSPSDDFPVDASTWNRTYGWGYMNVGATFYNGTDVFTDTIGDGDALDSNRLYFGNNYLGDKATLVWNRHGSFDGANGTNSMLPLTDLDLSIYRLDTGGLLDSSLSGRDNVEQIDCPATWCFPSNLNIKRPVLLKVSTWGSIDTAIGRQEYSLATEENFFRVQPPRVAIQSVSFRPPLSDISPGQVFEMEAAVSNTSPDLSAPNSRVNLSLGSTTIVSGNSPASLGTLPANSSTQSLSWLLRAPCSTANRLVGINSATDSFGESWTQSVPNFNYTPNTATLQNHVSGVHLPRTFDFQVSAGGYTAILFRPEAANLPWSVDDSQCIGSPWISEEPAFARMPRVLLINASNTGAGTRYARAGWDSAVVQSAYDMNRAVSSPIPAAGGQRSGQLTFPDQMIKVVELTSVQAGRHYRVTLDNGSGVDGSLFVFDPSLTYGSPSAADWRSETAGQGVDESVAFTAPVSGDYAALIVYKSGTGAYTLSSRDITPRDIQVRSSGASGVSIEGTPGSASGTTDYAVADLTSSDPITLEAPFSLGDVEFASWAGCNSTSGTTCTVAPTGDRTVTVQYASIGHTLQVATSGASGVAIASAPSEFGGSTPYARDRIDIGTLITLTAPATHGPLGFVEWIGCDFVFGPDLRECEIFIESNRSARATYDDTSDDLFRDNFEGNVPVLSPPPPPP